jgi:hypothetical protein
MARTVNRTHALWGGVMTCLFITCGLAFADDSAILQQLQLMREQNEMLRSQLQKQQELIDSLSHEVLEIKKNNAQQSQAMDDLKASVNDSNSGEHPAAASGLGKVKLSGEAGVAFFSGGSASQFPNPEFRVDEARLFIDAPVWEDVYAYGELNLATRESSDIMVRLGELYVDFEDISKLWGQDRLLNVRAGRLYTPFGEEYQHRYAIDNPLISHSISDLWSLDEGIELYGGAGKFCYALAVQNGGIPDTSDFNGDKSVAARVGYDPTHWLHLSVSAMRTGDIDVNNDGLSAMWFGGGFFRSLGTTNTTEFRTDLVEGDIEASWRSGRAHAFGGYIHYDDNDPSRNNQRDVYYYSLEAQQTLVSKLYAAARFSQVFAKDGFPIVGNGSMGHYLFGPLTKDLWRLSVGLGYQWSRNLVVKAEYTFEQGQQLDGTPRDHENLFATEAAFSF